MPVAVVFIRVFTIGGFTGLILSVAPIDVELQDTCCVVAHFHYGLVAGSPWEGAEGLEWTVPSPAPFHTFETPPLVK